MVKMWILGSELAQKSRMKMSYTEKLIYTLNKPYGWVDIMLIKIKMWIEGYELVPEQMLKDAKIERLIYTLNKPYGWVNIMLTKMGIWGSELAQKSGMKMSYTEKLIYTLTLKHERGVI